MKRTVAYYRSSTTLQEESVDTQQYRIHQYALKNQMLIDDEYSEKAVSARKNKLHNRPEMKRLISDIHKGKIDRIIVYKRDRLARKVEEHLELYQLFKKHNVQVIFIAENEPPMRFDIFGELMELFIGVMNQREGEQITSRIIDTKIDNFLQGKSIGNLPYGYKANKKKTEIIRQESELQTVVEIFKEWNTDKYKNMEELAKELKTRGIKRRSKDWTRNNISDLLTNPMYMGTRVATFDHQRVSRSVKDLAIITPEDFSKAQELVDKRKTVRKEKQVIQYLLTDLFVCEICNKPLEENQRMKNGTTYAAYECKEHKIKVNQQEIENHVYIKTSEFFKNLLDSNFEKLYKSHSKKQLKELIEVQRRFEKELANAEEKLFNATNRWLQKETEAKKEALLNCHKEIEICKMKLFEIETRKQEILNIPENIQEIKEVFLKEISWELLSVKRKKELLKDLIHFIYADEFAIRIVFKHPFLESSEVVV